MLTRIGGQERLIQFRSEGPTARNADAAVAACLLPAMTAGGTLEIDTPVSPRLMRNQREMQAVQRAWSLGWDLPGGQLAEVELIAPEQVPSPPERAGRVAAFFSGGVDSWSTLLDHPEVTDLVFIRGFDLLSGLERHERVAPLIEERMRQVAGELGLELHVVETNVRDLSDPLVPWEVYFNSAAAAAALFLAPRFERILHASASDHEVATPVASAWLIDHLWSGEHLEIADDGGRFSRIERTARIADHPLVQKTLRVCWENRGAAYNCGACRKCLMTMITLEALGRLESVETFPGHLDLAEVATIEIDQVVLLCLWEDVLDAVREAGRPDLERAVEPVVSSGKHRLGLPAHYRRRRRPGPPPLRDQGTQGAPALSVEELMRSRSWRVTRPLRRAAAGARRARTALRRRNGR